MPSVELRKGNMKVAAATDYGGFEMKQQLG